jgi:glyoxylase-like metal-dependent hydrolase (beta-lactamase superfamily II)
MSSAMRPAKWLLSAAIALATGAGAAPIALSADAPPAFMANKADTCLQPASGFAFKVGKSELMALCDGSVPCDLQKILRDCSEAESKTMLADDFQTNPPELSVNAFLIRTAGKVILIDCGAGEIFGKDVCGRLPDKLRAVGVSPDQVTDICITHVHSDHSGGLMMKGERVFKNARVHVAKADVDFFLDAGNSAKTGYEKHFFDEASKTIKPYLDAGQIDAFIVDGEIAPGLSAHILPGHTPGSTLYTFENDGQKIVFTGDMVHVAPVQLPRPEITVAFDVDNKQAAANRIAMFTKFAEDKTLIAVPHFSFPGVGHLKKKDSGFVWVAVPYTDRLSAVNGGH